MKERLEDLLSDADKMLLEREVAERARESAAAEQNEVDAGTAVHFNRAPVEIKSALWRRYPLTGRLLAFALLLATAGSTYMAFSMPKAEGHYRLEMATVQGSGFYAGRQSYGFGRASATLLLQNGNVVVVRVDPKVTPPAGMRVHVRLYDTGAVRLESQN
jgi:hypothetical protein